MIRLGAVAVLAAGPAGADPGLAACRALAEDAARLACYDALPVAGQGQGRAFHGKGSGMTEPFEVGAPVEMHFDSDDAVMVLYLLDDQGRVVRNLHRGGAGAGRHLIEEPGRYHLQVNATGGWTIRLDQP